MLKFMVMERFPKIQILRWFYITINVEPSTVLPRAQGTIGSTVVLGMFPYRPAFFTQNYPQFCETEQTRRLQSPRSTKVGRQTITGRCIIMCPHTFKEQQRKCKWKLLIINQSRSEKAKRIKGSSIPASTISSITGWGLRWWYAWYNIVMIQIESGYHSSQIVIVWTF